MDYVNCFQDRIRYNLIYTDEDNALDVISSFLLWGIYNGKKCYYFHDHKDIEYIEYYFSKSNLDLAELIKEGKIEISSAKDFYINKSMYKDPSNILDLINKALDEGYLGVAVAADRECFLSGTISEDVLYEYEKNINKILINYPISTLSCYNIDKFGVDAIFALSNINPNFMYKNNNELYVHDKNNALFSPDEVLSIIYSYLKKREILWRKSIIYQMISNLSIELSYKKDERDIIGTALEFICSSVPADFGLAVLTDGEYEGNGNVIYYNAPAELVDAYYKGLYRIEIDKYNFIERIKCVVLNPYEVNEELTKLFLKYHVVSCIIIPLKYNGMIYGFIGLATQNRGTRFDDYSEFLYRICETIAKMIVEFRLNKKFQDSLNQARRMKELGELTGGIAHEFNNILTPIIAYAEVIREKIDDPHLLKYINLIEDSARDGSKIVRRIQEYSKSVKRVNEAVDIDNAIIQAIEITKPKWTLEAQMQKKPININLDLNSGECIEGVLTEVKEIFINIITNSVDAMPKGGDIYIKSYNQDGNVIIKVKDTGIGMEKVILKRIFKPFFTTKGGRGNGLGLYIVYKLVKQMGGHIEVESKVGSGTEFTIEFPLKKGLKRELKTGNIINNIRNLKIMVLDDQIQVADAISEMLRSCGCDIISVSDTDEAFEIYKKNDFDCILCDLALGSMSGVEISEMFRGFKKVPFILMTGWAGKIKNKDLKYIDAVIQKPFSIEEINKVINEVIKKEA